MSLKGRWLGCVWEAYDGSKKTTQGGGGEKGKNFARQERLDEVNGLKFVAEIAKLHRQHRAGQANGKGRGKKAYRGKGKDQGLEELSGQKGLTYGSTVWTLDQFSLRYAAAFWGKQLQVKRRKVHTDGGLAAGITGTRSKRR